MTIAAAVITVASLSVDAYLNWTGPVEGTDYWCSSTDQPDAYCGDLYRGETVPGRISMGSCIDECGPYNGTCSPGEAWATLVAGDCGWANTTVALTWDMLPEPENCSESNDNDFGLSLGYTGCIAEVVVQSAKDGKTLHFTDFAWADVQPNQLFNIVCNNIDSVPLRSTVVCTALTGRAEGGVTKFTTIDTTTRSIVWLPSTGTPSQLVYTNTTEQVFSVEFLYTLPAEFVDHLDLSYQISIEHTVDEPVQTVRLLDQAPSAPYLIPTPDSRLECWDDDTTYLCTVYLRDATGPVAVTGDMWAQFIINATAEGCPNAGLVVGGYKAGSASNFVFAVLRVGPCLTNNVNVTIDVSTAPPLFQETIQRLVDGSYENTPYEFSGVAHVQTPAPGQTPVPGTSTPMPDGEVPVEAPHSGGGGGSSSGVKAIEIIVGVLCAIAAIAGVVYVVRSRRVNAQERRAAASWSPVGEINDDEPSPSSGRAGRGASILSRGRAPSAIEDMEAPGPSSELESKTHYVAVEQGDDLAE
eukprot:TRINITY_DN25208_c0_g1_i1.p1 TRINITY_DN25208_c0_g1~~TRINITY_DN25208_c0_g1_i1.p1  ORF type:complete len:526 (+),score=107.09 TRINITY_DN25208_c0_g1_i1:72-1649(+)